MSVFLFSLGGPFIILISLSVPLSRSLCPLSSLQDLITISGYERNVEEARAAIEQLVSVLEEMVSQDVKLDHRVHARIIGARGKAIRKLMEEFKVVCSEYTCPLNTVLSLTRLFTKSQQNPFGLDCAIADGGWPPCREMHVSLRGEGFQAGNPPAIHFWFCTGCTCSLNDLTLRLYKSSG